MTPSQQKTAMSNRQSRINRAIKDDIERWSQQRLSLWLDDTVQRYKMADLTPPDAYAFLLTELLRVTAVSFAVLTNVAPDELGGELAKLVARLRAGE